MSGTAEAFADGMSVPRPGRVALAFAPQVRYDHVSASPIPEARIEAVLDDLRRRIVAAMARAAALRGASAHHADALRAVRVAMSGLLVAPLAAFLTATANPSLEPAAARRGASG
jgi:hypothetical protein